MFFYNGDVYDGELADDYATGKGTYSFHTGPGHVYKGTFLNSKRHGEGFIKNPDGSEYNGEWKED